MTIDKKVTDGLNMMAQMLTRLAMQYRLSKINCKVMNLNWLACEFKAPYKEVECHLDYVLKRLFKYEVDPDFTVGDVSGADSITHILETLHDLVSAAFDHATEQRLETLKVAAAGYTTDCYEHIIRDLEGQITFLDQQLNLIKVLKEPGYISARLGDK